VNFYSTYTSTVLGTQLLSEEKCFQKRLSEITYLLTYLRISTPVPHAESLHRHHC